MAPLSNDDVDHQSAMPSSAAAAVRDDDVLRAADTVNAWPNGTQPASRSGKSSLIIVTHSSVNLTRPGRDSPAMCFAIDPNAVPSPSPGAASGTPAGTASASRRPSFELSIQYERPRSTR